MSDPDLTLRVLEILIAAVCGLLVGSFLNVCIYRLPRGFSVVHPRSFCPECGKQVRWFDNIPLLSYCLLRGRCRDCRKSVSLLYPIVEITTGVLYGIIAAQYGWTALAAKQCIFVSLLIALFWTDWEERILPDVLTLTGIGIGLLFALFVFLPQEFSFFLLPELNRPFQSLLDSCIGLVLVAAPFWLLGQLYLRLRKRDGLGLGDVKLLALIGSFLGLKLGLLVVLLASLTGSVVGLLYIVLTHKSAAEYSLPFGSFLTAAGITVALLEVPARRALELYGY